MSFHRQVLGALIAGLVLTQPVSAQDKAVSVAVRGGGFNALTDLNDAGTADFKKTGYNVGGGIGIDFHKYVSLRGDVTFARNELRQNRIESGSELSRFFYDGALQLQYPTNGFQAYVFVGAGAVTLHPVGTSDSNQTKATGTAGLGVNYIIPGSSFAIGIEGKGWVYEFSEVAGNLSGIDKTQVEATWSAGVTYRLPFNGPAASR